MVLVCVPIPGQEIVKLAEYVSDVDADYKPHLYLYLFADMSFSTCSIIHISIILCHVKNVTTVLTKSIIVFF